ncbi:MAG: diacylglycerol kinase family protein [Burkholderiales bacterium]
MPISTGPTDVRTAPPAAPANQGAPAPVDPSAPLLFVVNAKSGHDDREQSRRAIEAELKAAGRQAEFSVGPPETLPERAREAAAKAVATRSAVVAVGGDGTINSVAQEVHAARGNMGFVPQGTFNLFARTHGVPLEAGPATRALLRSSPQPVQVGMINDQLFLVNASVGLYPDLLEDRESYKRRFGRNRIVAWISAFTTLTTTHRALHLAIEQDGKPRDVATPTLFVGNNRLQLERVGLSVASAIEEGSIAGVMLREASRWTLLKLLFKGTIGSLGEADTIESFKFQRMVVAQRRGWRRRKSIKVAYDGEVTRMRGPLEFRVAPEPLYLLKLAGDGGARR